MVGDIKKRKIAIVGAGVAGLSCARILQASGHDVTLFDKGRILGGRLASRERDNAVFDYGAQYLTVGDDSFASIIETCHREGVVKEWQGRFAVAERADAGDIKASEPPRQRFVGVPTMSALARRLVRDLPVLCLHRVNQIRFDNNLKTFSLTGGIIESAAQGGDEGSPFERTGYDGLVLNMPPSQIVDLIGGLKDDVLRRRLQQSQAFVQLSQVQLTPCFALMVQFDKRLACDFDGISIKDKESILSWVARDSSKPGRSDKENWVLHASPHWSEVHLEDQLEYISAEMLGAFAKLCGYGSSENPLPEPTFSKCHRWRFAIAKNPLEKSFLLDVDNFVGYCGDWCDSNKVQGAYLSGLRLAEAIETSVTSLSYS